MQNNYFVISSHFLYVKANINATVITIGKVMLAAVSRAVVHFHF